MLNAAQEQFGGGNPFAALANNTSHSNSIQEQQGRENNAPLPNPWFPGTGNTGSRESTTGVGNSTGASTGTGVAPSSGNSSTRTHDGSMQGLSQLLQSNPDTMRQMLNSPMTQHMMQQLASNPELFQQILNNNPMFRDNPQMRAALPALTTQVYILLSL